jgi:hypothetical protein
MSSFGSKKRAKFNKQHAVHPNYKFCWGLYMKRTVEKRLATVVV